MVLPDGRCDLILRSTGDAPKILIPVVTGPATRAYTVRFEKGDAWYGLRLRPENARMVWGTAINNAADTVLRGDAATAHVPHLSCVNDSKPPALWLKQFLSKLPTVPVSVRLTQAVTVIHATGGRIRMQHLAQIVRCSARHLNRLFQTNVGLSVKAYSQLAQFHRTLRLFTSSEMTITDAAFEGGYADHAHLTRAFQRYGGFAPSRIPDQLNMPIVFQP